MKKFKQFKSIFLGELAAYFNSPIAYIFIVVFVMMTSVLFMTNFFLMGSVDMRYFFDLLPIILCIFIPAISMRLWAEERRGSTFELLLTFPMSSYILVLSKFAASLMFYIIMLASTFFIPLMLTFVGKPDFGPIIGGYLGACFIGSFFLSIGIFISGLCKDQIVAFIITMMACFFFYLSGLDFIAGAIDGWIPGMGSFLKTNFGMTRHFLSFEKGVIDNRDVLYFIIMPAAFLILNMFSIEDRMRPKAKLFFSGTVGICLLISIILNSLIFDIPLGRFDLTKDKIYTITESTKNILKDLKAPVQVKLYISPSQKMPTAFKTLEQDIKDQLEELKVAANGKLDFSTFHMETTPESQDIENKDSLENRLQKKGIQPFQVQSIEEDEMGIKLIYSAISISYKEKNEEIIPNVIPPNIHNLEYELISKIYRMTLEKKPRIALVAPYSEKFNDPQIVAALKKIGQQIPRTFKEDKFKILDAALQYEAYELSRINLSEEEPLPDNIDTLIIVEPDELNQRQRYEINKFLYQGGNVIIAAQGYQYNYQPSRTGIVIVPQKKPLNINELLTHYGVTINDKLLMDENHQVLSISTGVNFGQRAMTTPIKAPMHVMVDQTSMNQDVSITGRLSSLFYLWGSALEINKEKLKENSIKETVLFTTSEQSWNIKQEGRSLTKRDIQRVGSYEKPQPLAVLLKGQFPDAFEGIAKPNWPQDDPENPPKNQEENEAELIPQAGNLLVIGCSSMFEENFIKNGGAINFFINAVDALTLGNVLINIRSQQPINRAMKKLEKMEKLWYRFLTIVLVPIIVIAFGSIRAFLRRKEKEQYMKIIKSA